MAKLTKWSNTAREAQGDGMASLFDGGYCRLYTGARPANAQTAVPGGAVLAATLRFADPAVASNVAGLLTMNAMTGDPAAAGSGGANVEWARFLADDGVTVICDGSVGVADANVILSVLNIVAGIAVNASGCTVTVPESSTL